MHILINVWAIAHSRAADPSLKKETIVLSGDKITQ